MQNSEHSSEHTFHVATPENVIFGYQVAGIGSRFLAGLVDGLIVFFVQTVLVVVALLVFSATGGTDLNRLFTPWLLAAAGLALFAINWGYYIFFELLWNGQTPGKRWSRLRVTRSDGLPVGLVEVLIRNLVRAVDMLPFGYGVGIIVMFIDRDARRLGDLAANTLVVFDRAEITLAKLEQDQQAISRLLPQNMQPRAWPVEHLSERDVQVVEDFMRRRGELANMEQFAGQMANRLAEKMGIDYRPQAWTETMRFLGEVVEARRARGRENQPVNQGENGAKD